MGLRSISSLYIKLENFIVKNFLYTSFHTNLKNPWAFNHNSDSQKHVIDLDLWLQLMFDVVNINYLLMFSEFFE